VPIVVFNLPDLGEGLPDAEIVEWHAKDGDPIKQGNLLVSVETDKAVVEVPSPTAGRVETLFGAPGEVVQVGAPLIAFASGNGTAVDSGTVVGEIQAVAERAEEATVTARATTTVGVKATPAVRALARRLEVDLALVAPSGTGGMILAGDVERAAEVLAEAGPLEPIRGVRRAMALRMSHAHAEVAPATVADEVDIEAWVDGGDITVRLVRAIAQGCASEPALNAWYDAQAAGRRLHGKVDLAIAVDTPDGLFVPVLRDIASRGPDDLRQGLERMKADIEARRLPPEEMRGATITLSNFGTIAGRFATPVVVPPQVAILSSGRVEPRVVAHAGQVVIHRTMPLSLTFDHRVVTGGEAARFLAAVMVDLAKPD
jgi:2-oxoisovalerate dehydrogenase E2 component (dihydrolipoyl transacylase)